MIEEAEDPKEVSTFHFGQLRTLKLAKQNEKVPEKDVNLVAAASKYGLLFVGTQNGFKILKLENILDLDEDKENKNIEENYYSQIVSCKTPVMLSLSSDQKTLAVCVTNNSSIVADMYDIAAFADPEETPRPFLNVQLSVNQIELKDFMWNPAIDAMYAYCLSDGSLHVHELAGKILKIIADQPQAAATALCWSPKGKQLVVGKKNGSFSQYKPTLQEVKNIPAPNLEEGPVYVASICWMSTSLFAVLYVPTGDNLSPSLVLVSTPKGSQTVYTNFYDVCLGNTTSSDQRYFMHYESAWEILICASTDSIEIAVVGDAPKWVQWDVKEDGKALLPGKDGATHAIGMGVMYCAQRRIVISEHESYPPMPVIFFLTNNGLLVPFHMINSAANAATLVRPSTPIERDNERRADNIENAAAQNIHNMPTQSLNNSPLSRMAGSTTANSVAPLFQPSSQMIHPSNTNNSVMKDSPFKAWSNNVSLSPLAPAVMPGKENSVLGNELQQFGPPGAQQSFQVPKSNPSVSGFGVLSSAINSMLIPSEAEKVHKLSKGAPSNITIPVIHKDVPANARQLAVAQRSIPIAENEPQMRVPTVPHFPPQPVYHNDPSKTVMRNDAKLSSQNTYRIAIAEEISNFEKELQDLKQSTNHVVSIGSKEEMSSLNSTTLNLQDFQKDMSETMQSLNSDIHSLKNVLLENFVMVEEAYSRERRKNDHSYISMLKDRALDPVTAKRMQKINQHYHYLITQMQEVNDKLDQDWIEYIEAKNKNKKAVCHLSSTEAIYKTIVNNQKIIHNLRNGVGNVSEKAMERKLENICKRKTWSHYSKRAEQEDLSKLADDFLQAKISNSENDENHFKSSKKISPKAQNILKKLLSSSNITTVRPTVIYSPSQSRLISKSLLYPDPSKEVKYDELKADERNFNPDVLPSGPGRYQTSSNVPLNRIKIVDESPKETKTAAASKFGTPSNIFSIAQLVAPSPPGETIYENITPPDSPFHPPENFHQDADVVTVSFTEDGYALVQVPSSSPLENYKGMPRNSGIAVSLNQPTSKSHSPSSRVSISEVQNFSAPSFQDKPLAPSSQSLSNLHLKPCFVPVLSDMSKTFLHKNIHDTSKENVINQKSSSSFQALSTNVSSNVLTTKSVSFPKTEIQTETSTSVSTKPTLNFSLGPQFVFSPASSSNATAVSKPLSFMSNNSSNRLEFDLQAPSKDVSQVPSKSFVSSPLFSGQIKESSKPEVPVSQATLSFFSTNNKPPAFALSKSSSETSFLSHKEGTSGELSFFRPQVSMPDFLKSRSLVEKEKVDSTSISSQKSPSESTTGSSSSVSVIETTTQSEPKNNFGSVQISGDLKSQTVTTESPTVQTFADQESNSTVQTLKVQPTLDKSSTEIEEAKDDNTVINSNTVTSPASLTSSEQTPTVSISSVFSLAATTSPAATSVTLFSNVSSTNTSSLFTQPSSTSQPLFSNTVSTDSSKTPFGENNTSASSVPSMPSTQPATTPSLFGQTSASSPVFVQSPNVSTTFSSPVSTTAAPVFGQQSNQTSFFGQPVTTQSSFFSKTTSDVPSFGQATVTQSSPFGQSLTNTSGPFSQGAATFFSQPTGGQVPVFGANAEVNNSGFGSPPNTGFSFGKSAFGQTAGSFGLAKSVFGQNASTFQPPASTSSSTFGQTSGSSVFGQGSFFSGLGGKPNPENASKNVFGVANLGKSSADSNLFGGSGSTAFGSNSGGSFSGGSFSSGNGSVAQSGFGAFQQSPQKPGSFGSPPSFGSAPGFGGAPAFGTPPAFGSGSSPIANPVFGGGGQQNANFSSFASANSPTFGSLASQNTGFGSPQQQPTFGQQSSPFGAAPVFGSSPSFGGQPSNFGTPSPAAGNASAFTQWRN